MEAKELLTELGKRLGIELDASDACSFEADGLAISINHVVELDAIALMGDLGEPPPEKLEGLYKTLLGANHLFGGTGGATISLDPDSDRIALCRALPLVTLDGETLYRELERFINTAETWAKIVADYRTAADAANEIKEDAPPAFTGNGFMQV